MLALIIFLIIAALAAGSALAYVVGGIAVLGFVSAGKIGYLAILPQRIFSHVDVFVLMAMVLFIMTGEVMNRSGVTQYLIDFAMSIVGRFKGGLGHVNILCSVFFAGISGSAVADAAALSNTLIPAMCEKGYPKSYAGAITAASSIIGPIIPPSIILIFYGSWMQVSIGRLFAAGILPGLLLGGVLLLANGIFAHINDHPGGKGDEVPPFWSSLRRSSIALTLPIIILGGIVFGVVTPTEAAALAVVVAMAAGYMYGGMNLSILYKCFERTAVLSGSIFMIMTAAACSAYISSLKQWPEAISQAAIDLHLSGVSFLLLVNVIFFIAGMFMDVPMALALLVPLFGPAAVAQGIDPTHLGVVLCLNLTMGLITPPLGNCMVVVAAISGENYWDLVKATLPFVLVEVVVLLIITLVPWLSLMLPGLLGLS